MMPLGLISSPPFSLKPGYSPSLRLRLRPINARYNQLKKLEQQRRRLKNGMCRAEFSVDAPVAIAIGACILSSLVFPATPSAEDLEDESPIDTADARFAVMGIISFIPYFNWMSWVFAWLDTGKRRYAVNAIVYLAPYLRSNLSISPEDSWLPITSILLGIVHIQLEASIKNGDLRGFQVFNKAAKKNSRSSREDGRKNLHNLPSAREEDRKDIREWTTPKKPYEDDEILDNGEKDNGGAKN